MVLRSAVPAQSPQLLLGELGASIKSRGESSSVPNDL